MPSKWYQTHDNVDEVITACKDEMHRRWGILDELTAEAQELKIGY